MKKTGILVSAKADKKAYMAEYRERFADGIRKQRRANVTRENKTTGISISFTEDPKAYMKAYYELNREKLLIDSRERGAKWRAENIEQKRLRARDVCAARKRDAFSMFGGKCGKCEFEDIRALQIDHVDGCRMSSSERTKAGEQGEKLYARLLSGRADRSKYQLLCANCNWIKRVEAGECRRKA